MTHKIAYPPDFLRWAVLLLLTPVLLLACNGPSQEQPEPKVAAVQPAAPGIIVAMGDSLTAGLGLAESEAYPALLTQRLAADGIPYRVINAGVSGETSSGARERINWILTLNPEVVVLETGANDGLRGLDTDRMAANIEAVITAFQTENVVVILAGMKMVRNLGADYVNRFEAVYPDIANRRNPIFVPFFLEGVAGKPKFNLADGIHPNAAGHRIIADTIYPAILKAIATLAPRG